MSFGGLTFLAPLGLLGLLVLPLMFWLLRATPPKPKTQVFPPVRILADVLTQDETPNSSPWWLLLFRLGLVAILAVALARPIVSATKAADAKPLVLLIDNGYASAANWGQTLREAEARLSAARRANVDAALGFSYGDEPINFTTADAALERLKTAQPLPLAVDYTRTAQRLSALDMSKADAVWLSGGLDYGKASLVSDVLSAAKSLSILAPPVERAPIITGAISETQSGFSAQFLRFDTDSLRVLEAVAYSADGAVIARAPLVFSAGNKAALAQFNLPADLRNRVSLVRVDGAASAGAVAMLDDSWGRPVVGILPNLEVNAQPLLSDVYYVEKALSSNADVFKAPLDELLTLGPSLIIMSDSARIEDESLTDFVDNGGLLVRFAGPKLAARADALVPVTLRYGGRALGGALTWEEPQSLAPFADDSPFYGLAIPKDVTVSQQVMAQPGGETDQRTWARLSDGSPVVTAAARGQGRIVLFHVTSGPQWSNLAVSGLYVDMLKRILPLARKTPTKIQAQGGTWSAQRVLDGYGRLTAPPPSVLPIADGQFVTTPIDGAHPPGYYRQGARRKALNAVRNPDVLSTIAKLPNVKRKGYGQRHATSLTAILLAIGLVMLFIDALISLAVSGRFKRLLKRPAILGLLLAGLMAAPNISEAQTALEADTLGLHLAYVITGNDRLDRQSLAGLRGVTQELTSRTTVEPNEPRGVIPGRDTLAIYPLLYWPVSRDAPALDAEQSRALNAYMNSGGTIVFDTMDEGDRISGLSRTHAGLTRISESLDIPALSAISKDHVLTKAFFLLPKFPGRWANGAVYVDANAIAARDGVASVIVGSNDWASAWAVNEQGDFIGSLDETIPRQREMANRFGVNLVMYVLSGSYKADQVHYAAILERLGTSGTSMQKTPSVEDPDR